MKIKRGEQERDRNQHTHTPEDSTDLVVKLSSSTGFLEKKNKITIPTPTDFSVKGRRIESKQRRGEKKAFRHPYSPPILLKTRSEISLSL